MHENDNAPSPRTPQPFDCLGALHRRGLISEAQREAGKRLRAVARGLPHPGLFPNQSLINSWPQALQLMWRALRAADSAVPPQRPAPPTPSSSTWSAAVLNLRCGQDDLAKLEVKSIKAGLEALAQIAEEVAGDDTRAVKGNYLYNRLLKHRPDLAARVDAGEISVREAIRLGGDTLPRRPCDRDPVPDFIVTGKARVMYRLVRRARPDLIPLLDARKITLAAAHRLAQAQMGECAA